MREVLVNRLGGLSLPRKSVVRVTDRPNMTLDVYRGRKTTIQYNTIIFLNIYNDNNNNKNTEAMYGILAVHCIFIYCTLCFYHLLNSCTL